MKVSSHLRFRCEQLLTVTAFISYMDWQTVISNWNFCWVLQILTCSAIERSKWTFRSFENDTNTLGRNVEHLLSMMALHPRRTGTSSTPLRMLNKLEDFTVLYSPFSVFCVASFRNVLSENFWFFPACSARRNFDLTALTEFVVRQFENPWVLHFQPPYTTDVTPTWRLLQQHS